MFSFAAMTIKKAASSPLTCSLLILNFALSGIEGFLPKVVKGCQNGANVSSLHSWILDAFQAGLPFGVSIVDEGVEPEFKVFKEQPEEWESYYGRDGFADSTRKGVEGETNSTKWISVIRQDLAAGLLNRYGPFGFLFSLDHLWPHAVKGTMYSLDRYSGALSRFELIDEEHPSKSCVYGKRGDRKEAQAEFDADLQEMIEMSVDDPSYHNKMRVLGDRLPADAFVGIVLHARKVIRDRMSLQKLETEKARIISAFMRLTGRADAPIFAYYPKDETMASGFMNETGVESVLWQISKLPVWKPTAHVLESQQALDDQNLIQRYLLSFDHRRPTIDEGWTEFEEDLKAAFRNASIARLALNTSETTVRRRKRAEDKDLILKGLGCEKAIVLHPSLEGRNFSRSEELKAAFRKNRTAKK